MRAAYTLFRGRSFGLGLSSAIVALLGVACGAPIMPPTRYCPIDSLTVYRYSVGDGTFTFRSPGISNYSLTFQNETVTPSGTYYATFFDSLSNYQEGYFTLPLAGISGSYRFHGDSLTFEWPFKAGPTWFWERARHSAPGPTGRWETALDDSLPGLVVHLRFTWEVC